MMFGGTSKLDNTSPFYFGFGFSVLPNIYRVNIDP